MALSVPARPTSSTEMGGPSHTTRCGARRRAGRTRVRGSVGSGQARRPQEADHPADVIPRPEGRSCVLSQPERGQASAGRGSGAARPTVRARCRTWLASRTDLKARTHAEYTKLLTPTPGPGRIPTATATALRTSRSSRRLAVRRSRRLTRQQIADWIAAMVAEASLPARSAQLLHRADGAGPGRGRRTVRDNPADYVKLPASAPPTVEHRAWWTTQTCSSRPSR